MTRQEAKELLPIITAFADGKEVQLKTADTGRYVWKDQGDALAFSCPPQLYRVKPEPNKIYIVRSPSGIPTVFFRKEDAEAYHKEHLYDCYTFEEYTQVLPS